MLRRVHLNKLFWVYPFLFAIFPALSVYNDFTDQIHFNYVLYASLALVVFCLGLLAVFWFITKDIKKSRISVAFLFLFTFMFNVINLIFPDTRFGIYLSFIFLCLIVVLIIYLIYKKVKDPYVLELGLSIVSVTLMAIILFSVINHKLLNKSFADYTWQSTSTVFMEKLYKEVEKPDIYFIVLDGYARHDVLFDIYDHDNTQFLNYLEEKEFYVVDKSASNYSQTRLYMASLLNMDYIDNLIDVDPKSRDLSPIVELIKYNNVTTILNKLGYKTVFMSSNSEFVDFIDSDYSKSYLLNQNVFNQVFLMKTPLPYLFSDLKYNLHRKSINYTFESLPVKIETLTEPVFVFTHILPPHPPFVFDEDGNKTTPDRYYTTYDGNAWNRIGGTREEYIEGYRSQLKYVNKRTEQLISEIFNKAEKPFVIIIQSDHGPSSEFDWSDASNDLLVERLSTLYAIYYSDEEYSSLNDTTTPVNTFRLIFNKYFGSNLTILEDKSFFSTYEHPYEFIEVDVNQILDKAE